MIEGKKILLGITGSIAAYKTAFLVRLLVKKGALVKVVMTEAATTFITPLTLSTLSKNKVYTSFTNTKGEQWNNHVELGLWADLLVIAPASANTLAKMATGLCDNLLTAVYLSAKCPTMVAPAMDRDMWLHPTTQDNLDRIIGFGNQVIPAEEGELASGLIGTGRLAEPESIVVKIEKYFNQATPEQDLKNKTVLITAGPTKEALDPVRFISNPSSGKMGIALAEEAAKRGAEVQLVLGPTHLKPTNTEIEVIQVVSAADMFEAVDKRFDDCHWAIMTAAVADFTPMTISTEKIKKTGKAKTEGWSLPLKRTKDILKTMGQRKQKNQRLIGFALETQNGRENAQKKLVSKNADCIVLNSPKVKGAGFQHDTNQITILDRNGGVAEYDLKPKTAVAKDIIDYVFNHFG